MTAVGAAEVTLGETADARRTRSSRRSRYRVFGSVLESDMEFPELIPIDGPGRPRWAFRIETSPPPACSGKLRGERQLGAESYSLWETPDGFRLEYSHAGVFDLCSDGTQIIWYEREGALEELVRTIVLGPVLAVALELTGLLCLHGSAVAIGGRAAIFLGPKHHGKSTLATALTVAGAQLIGDDLIAISPGPPAMVRPGVPSVRLWDDAVTALPLNEICGQVLRGVKTTASGFAKRAFTSGELPIDAIYILTPVSPLTELACARTRLPGAAAAIGLAHQTKLPDSLIGIDAAGSKLAAAARVALTVPVWTLAAARDLARLPDVVEQVIAWTAPNGQ